MPRKPIRTLLQLYGAPYPFWAATRKAIRLVKESGGTGLLKAAKQKLARPNLPIDVLRADSGKRLTFEERWVTWGEGLTRRHSVSVIILTQGNQALIDACLTSLVRSTLPRARLEVIVVNNGGRIALPSTYPFPLRLLREIRRFSWAAYNNRAAEQSSGEFLLFLNDDVEALHGGWLDAMLLEGTQPAVGAVGSKLLYPSGAIQHSGVVLTRKGEPEHVYRFQPRNHPGEAGECLAPRPVVAVTGACLLTRRRFFQDLGGFDERFATNYNDVDYCLRLHEAGWRVIATPYAELIHRETTTRGLRIPLHEKRLFRGKWNRNRTPLEAQGP